MQLGFVSAVLGDLDFDGVLATAARLGFDCVEAMCWPPDGPDKKFGSVTHLDLTALTQDRADDILAVCERHGVAISALGFYSVPLSADREQAETAADELRTEPEKHGHRNDDRGETGLTGPCHFLFVRLRHHHRFVVS